MGWGVVSIVSCTGGAVRTCNLQGQAQRGTPGEASHPSCSAGRFALTCSPQRLSQAHALMTGPTSLKAFAIRLICSKTGGQGGPPAGACWAQTEFSSGCGAASPSQGPWDPDPLRPALRLGGLLLGKIECRRRG